MPESQIARSIACRAIAVTSSAPDSFNTPHSLTARHICRSVVAEQLRDRASCVHGTHAATAASKGRISPVLRTRGRDARHRV